MLTEKERKIVDDVLAFMSYEDNLIKDTQDRTIQNVSHLEIPKGASIMIFGGYKSIAFHAVDAINKYRAKHQEWPEVIITGKSSNKMDNTAGLGSEVNAYHYILESCGIPKEVTRKNYVEPKDMSTAENIQSLDKILETYPNLKKGQIVLFTQPYYARRVAHEFGNKSTEMPFMIANLPKLDIEKGVFYNDRLDGSAVDVAVGACFYQSMYNDVRWTEKNEALAPTKEELSAIPSKEDIVPIIAKYSAWSYPNNLVDLGISKDLESAKQMIDARKAELFKRREFTPEGHLQDIKDNIALYQKKQSLLLNSKARSY